MNHYIFNSVTGIKDKGIRINLTPCPYLIYFEYRINSYPTIMVSVCHLVHSTSFLLRPLQFC